MYFIYFAYNFARRVYLTSQARNLEQKKVEHDDRNNVYEVRKGPTEIIRKTANPRTIQIWAKIQQKCNEVLQDLDELPNRDEPNIRRHRKIKHLQD